MRRLIALLLFALAAAWAGGPGFRTSQLLDAHYKKHGREFGNVGKQEYLRMAQELRDAPPGPNLLEAKRPDGAFSRFDRKRGWFGAYNRDRTIRTFFIPTDGERYFRRQARRDYD